MTAGWTVLEGDCRELLRQMPERSVHCCVTSPPYLGLRDYGHADQIGLEETPDAYAANLVEVFREVRRVLRDDGTLWLNLGDSFANDGNWGGTTGGKHAAGLHGAPVGWQKRQTGLKPKDLIGVPWLVAFALRADGWYLRSDIIWAKPNPMPESVTDRPTRSHEYLFLLTKRERYYYDAEAIKEPCVNGERFHGGYDKEGVENRTTARNGRKQDALGKRGCEVASIEAGVSPLTERNKRSVWNVNTSPFPGAHFAAFPPDLIRPCVRAGCPAGGTILDPFCGSGTTGQVAIEEGRRFIGLELNADYVALSRKRIGNAQPGMVLR